MPHFVVMFLFINALRLGKPAIDQFWTNEKFKTQNVGPIE